MTESIAARIEAAYMRSTGKPDAYGARAWFARQARVRPYTVSRWVAGSLPFSGPPLAVLELLEGKDPGRGNEAPKRRRDMVPYNCPKCHAVYPHCACYVPAHSDAEG